MNIFSVFDYNNLSDSQKADFNKALIQRLSPMMEEIKIDDVIGLLGVDKLVASPDVRQTTTIVTDLYSKVSAGIQAGSGNQSLFYAILSAITESWKQINKK